MKKRDGAGKSFAHSSLQLGVILVVLGQFSSQLGAGSATFLFPEVGALGTVTLRLVISALLLMVIFRPKLRGLTREAWIAAITLGVVLACMNTTLYLALARLPLGTTITIEILGPLLLAVILSRRLASWGLAVIAFCGVWLLGVSDSGSLDTLGVIYALAAAFFWACYILASRRTALLFERSDGLAIAMVVAAVLVSPAGIAQAGVTALIQPRVLLFGFLVAVLSSALLYGLEQSALRRIPTELFAMLMSLAPVVAAIVGWVMLGQDLAPLDIVGIALVVVATAIAMRQQRRPTL